VTRDSKKATEKAKKIVTAAVYRVLQHEPMEIRKVPINPDVLIVGGWNCRYRGGIAIGQCRAQSIFAGKRTFNWCVILV